MNVQLLQILGRLKKEQREDFIWYLKNSEMFNGIPNIQECDLPKDSDNLAIVDQIVATYGRDAAKNVVVNILKKIPRNDLVAILAPQQSNSHPSSSSPPTTVPQQPNSIPSSSAPLLTGPEFLRKHRRAIAERISLLAPILNDLEDSSTLRKREKQAVKAAATPIEQNEALIEMICNKGETAENECYQALRRADPSLVADLERNG